MQGKREEGRCKEGDEEKESKDKKFLNATIHSIFYKETLLPCLNKTYNKKIWAAFEWKLYPLIWLQYVIWTEL